MIGSKVMALSKRYSGLERRSLRIIEWRFHIYSYKYLMEIQRSDQMLWPFQTGTLVSSDDTSASPSSDSTCTPTKTASRNSCKNLIEIQWSDQKLWPFRTGTQVSSDDPSASSSSDSTSTTRKTVPGNSCKNLIDIHQSDQNLWPFRTVLWSRAKIPPHHRVAIPCLLLGKRRPETLVKF
jgi:hypothetical protein